MENKNANAVPVRKRSLPDLFTGEVAIIWNDRAEGDALRAAVDQLLDQYGGTKRAVLHAHEDRSYFYRFFGRVVRKRVRSQANNGSTKRESLGSYSPDRTCRYAQAVKVDGWKSNCEASSGALSAMRTSQPAIGPLPLSAVRRERPCRAKQSLPTALSWKSSTNHNHDDLSLKIPRQGKAQLQRIPGHALVW